MEYLKRFQLVLSLLLRASLLIAMFGALVNRRWTVLFLTGLTLLLTFIPALIKKNLKISLPPEFEIALVVFIYTGLFMGEVHAYYTKFWWWDVALHASSAVVFGFIGFIILYLLYDEKKIIAKPLTIALFTFCFALAMGACWEIFEFSMDQTFGWNMQRSGLVDTMWDLIVDTIGAFIASVLGFLYIKGGKRNLFEHMMNMLAKENPQLFKNVD